MPESVEPGLVERREMPPSSLVRPGRARGEAGADNDIEVVFVRTINVDRDAPA